MEVYLRLKKVTHLHNEEINVNPMLNDHTEGFCRRFKDRDGFFFLTWLAGVCPTTDSYGGGRSVGYRVPGLLMGTP